jgi:hypothetical protein
MAIRGIPLLAFARYTAVEYPVAEEDEDVNLEVIVCAVDDALAAITAAGCTYEIIIPSSDYTTHLANIDVDTNA